MEIKYEKKKISLAFTFSIVFSFNFREKMTPLFFVDGQVQSITIECIYSRETDQST